MPSTSEEATRTVRPKKDYEKTIDFSMRARQLASTVRTGRKILFSILDEDPIEGYLAGWDQDTYFVVSAPYAHEVAKLLIPKNSILFIQLQDEKTFREEPLYEIMNSIVKPFRDHINSNYFENATV